jgi:hypothetical protein
MTRGETGGSKVEVADRVVAGRARTTVRIRLRTEVFLADMGGVSFLVA